MKALKIEIEIAYNNKLEFVNFTNECVFKAIKKVQKLYPSCYIYSIKTEY